MPVPARISLATLGVADLERSTRFYRALGWELSSASVAGEVSFFHTAGGILAVWGAYALAGDAAVDNPGGPPAYRGVALAINVGSVEEVDESFAAVEAAGGRVTKAPEHAEWGGYSGYFADPDGHLWEIAYNPGWPLGDDGLPRLP